MKRSRRHFIRLIVLSLAGSKDVFARVVEKSGSLAEASILPELRPTLALTRRLQIPRDRWQIIVGHHAGVPTGNAAIYDRYHRSRGMENGLAYHFVIGNGTRSKDGEIEIGGRWQNQLPGGHVRDDAVNEVGIGICLVGNFEETDPTPAQLRSFTHLVHHLKKDVLGRSCRFAVHREIDPGHTACPGRRFPTTDMHRRFG